VERPLVIREGISSVALKSMKRNHIGLRAGFPPDEARRLATLYALELLDRPPEEQFDRITRMAQRLFDVPVAIVSFIDADRDWFKSQYGLAASEFSRELSFASHTILDPGVLVVNDASRDLRFYKNPFVQGPTGIRFYAGCPVNAWNGVPIGAVSIMSNEPRSFTEDERTVMRDLAASVEHEIGVSTLNVVDELTGLVNGRGLRLVADHVLPRANRDGEAVSMLFLDIENLDGVNRKYGRSAGNATLVEIADILRETLRRADIPARMRGDDFALLLPDTDEAEANVAIVRIQRAIALRQEQNFRPFEVKVQIARATIDPSASDFSLDGLIAMAESTA